MAEYTDREHYIPLRRSDLIELLCGDANMTAEARGPFRDFCRLIIAMYHFEYHQKLETLKGDYAAFNPDAVECRVKELSPEERQREQADLFECFAWLMERANFKQLTDEQIEAATQGASEWGVNLDVDFTAFEHLRIYVRGDGIAKRNMRRWLTFWRLDEVSVPIFKRLVVILKQKKHRRLGRNPDTKSIFLKLFKDIPKLDLEMLLPGGRVQMPKFERGKLGASLLATVGWVAYKIWVDFAVVFTGILALKPLAFWGPLSLIGGYGYKQWYGFQTLRQAYSFQLTQSLYYQNLDNNAGVLHHLLDEAEEQECREAILAYFYLWRFAGAEGWTAASLDDYVELDLERLARLKVDFEIGDALDKLLTLGITEKTGDRYRALPLARALEVLRCKWEGYFGSKSISGAAI
jgi:hypothetical protein